MDAEGDDRIIKSGAVGEIVRPWLDHTGDTWASAEAHRALTDARAIVEAARADADAVLEAARHAGLARGVAKAARLLDDAERLRVEQLRAASDDVAVLAVAIARKLVDSALLGDPELITSLVERSLDDVGDARRVRIFVAAESSAALETARDRLADARPESTLTIEIDPALAAGDCRIETERGHLDASLDLQFENLLRALIAEASA